MVYNITDHPVNSSLPPLLLDRLGAVSSLFYQPDTIIEIRSYNIDGFYLTTSNQPNRQTYDSSPDCDAQPLLTDDRSMSIIYS